MTKRMENYSLKRRFERNKQKHEKKFKKDNVLNFDIDMLEQRVLLSADPITSSVQALLLNDDTNDTQASQVIDLGEFSEDVDSATTTGAINESISTNNTIILDAKELSKELTTDTLIIDDNTILKGSGTLEVDLINNNIIAPGYSPGIENIIGDYTQASDAILQIELSGTDNSDTNSPEYDELNISGNASLDGTLEISILNDYELKEGDRFDIITYGSVSGKFGEITGLFGFGDGSLYLDVEESESGISLVVKEIGANIAIDIGDIKNENDYIGETLNADYFQLENKILDVTGKISIADFIYIEGS